MTSFQTSSTTPPLSIEVVGINPNILQRVMSSISMPRRPTYEVKTFSGRVEEHPLDEKVLETHPEYQSRWAFYQEELDRLQAEQNTRMVKAMCMLGTQCTLPDGWESKDRALGLDVPDDPDERRAHYLMTHLHPDDLTALMAAIMRETGVSEEAIQEAEDTFRDSVRDRSERSDVVVDAASDPQAVARKFLEAQPGL